MPELTQSSIQLDCTGYDCLLKSGGLYEEAIKITPQSLAQMTKMIQQGTISSKIAKQVFQEMLEKGSDPEAIVRERGWVQISDEGKLREIVRSVIEANPQSVIDYKNGKDRALGFMVGQVMKKTRGKANPQLVNQLIHEVIES